MIGIRVRVLLVAVATTLLLTSARAATPQLAPWANRNTVDTDGDGIPDLVDNAPGVANDQADNDADGIGNVIDPTPNNSNPALGDPGLGMLGPYTIFSGSSVSLDYAMVLQVPPGAWGHVDLDLGGNGVYDATYFGPLTASFNQIVIPPNQYEIPGVYSQNVLGSYAIYAKAFGPGMQSQNVTITNVNVIPEPASLCLVVVAGLSLGSRRRRPRA
jgi:Thrombospondin type 3 repeat